MKPSVFCLLFSSLLVIVLPRGNDGHKLEKNLKLEEIQRKNFKEYDADNNGYISLHEFRIEGIQNGLGEYIEFLMEEYDTNKDDQLSFEEFQVFYHASNEEKDN